MAHSLPGPCQALLAAQHGVLARWQASQAGLDAAVIEAKIRRGRWQPLYRGVYATFTGRPDRLALMWAAVLRAGPEAALSHHTAAELDRLADSAAPAIHVTVPGGRQVRRGSPDRGGPLPRVVVHRSARIEMARHPARTPPRTRIEETALDLTQAVPSLDEAWSWLARACNRRLTTPGRLRLAMAARTRVRWRADLSVGLADIGEGILSALERRYVRRVERRHGLPVAHRQFRSAVDDQTRYLDNVYQEFGVVVELDGQASHPAEMRWLDIRRDNASAALGMLTLRYGWVDAAIRACSTAAEVGTVLRTRGWTGRPRPCGPDCPARLS